MIPNWIKNEDEIYNRLKDLRNIYGDTWTGIDDLRRNYYRYLETDKMEGRGYAVYQRHRYINIPSGIEIDNNKLKPISVIITNWERQYYIPLIMEMYNNQDYPKNFLEFIIVDDDSVNKAEVLGITKEQTRLYPDIKIRFIQNYINRYYNPTKRRNIGIRTAKNNIVLLNETDTLPLGKNFLRGICFSHNLFRELNCLPINISFASNVCESDDKEMDWGDISQALNQDARVHYRLEHEYVQSFDKELISSIQGYDEDAQGWGGHDWNTIDRYCRVGGKMAINTAIYSGLLKNFGRKLPSNAARPFHSQFPNQGTANFQSGSVINDENWGISEKMEEINLYS
jgi:hypothetical protein